MRKSKQAETSEGQEDILIKVKDVCFGGVWGSAEKGLEIDRRIRNLFLTNSNVILCFEGVSGYSVKTLQAAFIGLVKEYGQDIFKTKIKLKNLDISDNAFMNEVLSAIRELPNGFTFEAEAELPKMEISKEILDKVKVKKRRKK